MPVLNPQALIDERVNAIRAFHKQVGLPRAEIDVSGGVDSAVVLGLLARALGPENITAVYQGIASAPSSLERARDVAKVFGVRLIECDWTQTVRRIHELAEEFIIGAGVRHPFLGEVLNRCNEDPTVLGSLRSTFRAPMGRFINRLMGNGVRHGTGNEDEDRWMRFYQKGGDGEVDTNPIAFLSKGEVWQLALALGVPKSILEARPSPDLWGTGDQHNDEDEIKSYLGLPKDCPYPMYSYVDFATGQYKNVGLIERVNRFLDGNWQPPSNTYAEKVAMSMFDAVCPPHLNDVLRVAGDCGLFSDVDPGVVAILLESARRVERTTRHKFNPNIPMLGCRQDLVSAGVLTNELPV